MSSNYFCLSPRTFQLLCCPAGANRVLVVLVGGTCSLSMAHHPLTGQLLQQDGCGGVYWANKQINTLTARVGQLPDTIYHRQ